MNIYLKYTLKVLRKLHLKVFNSPNTQLLQYESDPNIASDMIFNMLTSNSPCMIARYGAFELSAIVNYIGVNKESRSFIKYIKGEVPDWWWNSSIFNYMHNNAGFFPPTPESISEFSKLMLKDSEEVDILGSWQQNEQYLQVELSQSQRIKLIYIDPFWSARPWSRALRDKKILVVHPFAETILSQYEKRDLLFDNKEILPEFRSLQVIKLYRALVVTIVSLGTGLTL